MGRKEKGSESPKLREKTIWRGVCPSPMMGSCMEKKKLLRLRNLKEREGRQRPERDPIIVRGGANRYNLNTEKYASNRIEK